VIERERERGTVMSMRPQPLYPMAPPFSAQTMPLGFVPVEPISRHAGAGRAARGERVATGRDGYQGRAGTGGSCIISCGTGRQLAAATAVAAASSIAADKLLSPTFTSSNLRISWSVAAQ